MSKGQKEQIKTKAPEELAAELESELGTVTATKVNTLEAEQEEEIKLEEEKLYKIRRLKAEVEKLEQDNEGRRVLRNSIFTITVVWMFLILMLVFHAGRGTLKYSDTVLVALITTTTANVFGFLYVVVNYLYNKDKST